MPRPSRIECLDVEDHATSLGDRRDVSRPDPIFPVCTTCAIAALKATMSGARLSQSDARIELAMKVHHRFFEQAKGEMGVAITGQPRL